MSNRNTKKYWDDKYVEMIDQSMIRSDGDHLNKFLPEFEKADSILDFGGGLGGNVRHLSSFLENKRFLLVDHSETALQYASEKYLGKNDERGNTFVFLTNLSRLEPASIDFILSIEVLEHITDYRNILDKFWELLKPEGKLLISVPVKGWRDRNREHVNKFTVKKMFEILSEYSEIVQISERTRSKRSGILSTAYFLISKERGN